MPGSDLSSPMVYLYYRFPHETGIWKQATTMTTDAAGDYNATATVPGTLTPGQYDIVAVWFDPGSGKYAVSKVVLLTIT